MNSAKNGDTPSILIIDDRDQESALRAVLQGKKARVAVRHPQDVEQRDLQRVHLILVDFQMDAWPERDKLEALCLKPTDGLAVAGVLRRHRQISTPVAIAIHTGKIKDLAGPLPAEHREHALARFNNLEWVFRKATPGHEDNRPNQILSLARAVAGLPRSWEVSGETLRKQLMTLLG